MDSPVPSSTPPHARAAAAPILPASVNVWIDAQRREIILLRAARARRSDCGGGTHDGAAMYGVLHRLYRWFAAVERGTMPSDLVLSGTEPTAVDPKDDDKSTAAASACDANTADIVSDFTAHPPAYASFGDVCESELGMQRSTAQRAIKETLVAGLFRDVVVAPMATAAAEEAAGVPTSGRADGDVEHRCDDKDDDDDAALVAHMAPSSYRCLLGVVTDWSAPHDWTEWSAEALASWLRAPDRAVLLDALRSLWHRTKARANVGGGEFHADAKVGRDVVAHGGAHHTRAHSAHNRKATRSQDGSDRTTHRLVRITRRHIEAALADMGDSMPVPTRQTRVVETATQMDVVATVHGTATEPTISCLSPRRAKRSPRTNTLDRRRQPLDDVLGRIASSLSEESNARGATEATKKRRQRPTRLPTDHDGAVAVDDGDNNNNNNDNDNDDRAVIRRKIDKAGSCVAAGARDNTEAYAPARERGAQEETPTAASTTDAMMSACNIVENRYTMKSDDNDGDDDDDGASNDDTTLEIIDTFLSAMDAVRPMLLLRRQQRQRERLRQQRRRPRPPEPTPPLPVCQGRANNDNNSQ
ncbi:hypothetical protein pmac_cds_924 [Pandoravirus macleodensis]|uniref:Uncharacterized protein n=1 Tax=Pandoravirus macleodensis TaxID=2107707 RepID=A0A2U7UGP1_9VIRU|nr:hypothetical protein pmac_cds_924 [Pandoravirus macleodensis]AVK77612.1 hypothetical protein pmac_cds_924 [Pandoravirus macleodensis]